MKQHLILLFAALGAAHQAATEDKLYGVCNTADNTCTLQQPHFLGRDEFGYAQFRYEEVIMPCDDATPCRTQRNHCSWNKDTCKVVCDRPADWAR
ncbi:hypothetical protein ACCO45_003417 [Purpureocillium lilacinum]|uniref:Uncharacterized protein n=1 Tax=Purpureocillium lilacinum TaxID=33203 RepID=A0ACC4DZV7_PURLI